MAEEHTFNAHGLSLPNAFSAGQLFAFSGVAGENLRRQDWCGVLTGNPGEICFAGADGSSCRMLLRFSESTPAYDAVVSDLIAANGGAILVTFADAQTIVGRSDMPPAIRLESEEYVCGDRTISDGAYAFALAVERTDAGFAFALCRRTDTAAAEADARNALAFDADALADAVLDWYGACPPCPLSGYEKLWYKCLSVNRANVFSPQDGFRHFFTTPARPAQREPRTWDACFHAMAMAHYAPDLAKDTVFAALECQCADGFIPNRMTAHDKVSGLTLPPVLCTTILNIFEATGDVDLLLQTAEPLRRYLEWDLQNRCSPNGLMTWHMQSDDASARCAESGMDDSPRFDAGEQLDAIDFSALVAYELLCLHRIYMTLGDHMSALRTEQIHRRLVERIHARLWDRQTQCFYDRTWGGAFRRLLTPASFLPLFAGICDPRQAHCIVKRLTPLLECPFPIPSAADEQGGYFTRDTWRGGVWLSYNYLIYVGLQRYGFGKQAAQLRQKTLEGVKKQFRSSGSVFSFYDPLGNDPRSPDRTSPEAPQILPVADCNGSASCIQLFLRT